MNSGVPETLKGFSVLPKNLWKVSATFSSFEMILSFSVSAILSLDLILFEKKNASSSKTF